MLYNSREPTVPSDTPFYPFFSFKTLNYKIEIKITGQQNYRMDILKKYTEFHKIREIYFNDRCGLYEFLNNVVMNTGCDCYNGNGIMLRDFSDIYVLVSNEDFPFDKFKMNRKITIDLSAAKESFVLGYIWISSSIKKYEGCNSYHFIQFIDTRISGLNMAKYMIEKYEMMNFNDDCILFPQQIVMGAQYYWKKYFMEVYEIKNKADLLKMITDFKFGKYDIQWEHLISAFEM